MLIRKLTKEKVVIDQQKSFLNKDNEETKKFVIQANTKLRDNLYNSYDFLLNEKYNIDINQNTLERMKNYFK